MSEPLTTFLSALESGIRENRFVKLTLGKYRGDDPSLRNIFIKPITLARGDCLSFVYRHATRDVTKVVTIDEGVALVRELLGLAFLSAHLFTTANDMELSYNKKREPHLRTAKASHSAVGPKQHDRVKNRPVGSDRAYLSLLGVTHDDGTVRKSMEAKFRQINKFVEIVEYLLAASPLRDAASIAVVDMGSGKGYLTFALYDYLANTLQKTASVRGIEVRPELVELCNRVATDVGFTGLQFEQGSIEQAATAKVDILIALHACDTATDEALYKAIAAEASLILCAPCCHKELRPQMQCAVAGLDRVLKSGILLERQSELVTDGVRALLLEAAGYKTTVFEFIATEHTSKNIMISGVKSERPPDRRAILAQIEALKTAFGFETQRLQVLLSRERRSER